MDGLPAAVGQDCILPALHSRSRPSIKSIRSIPGRAPSPSAWKADLPLPFLMEVPHTRPGRWLESVSPARFASAIREGDPGDAAVAILGLPDDTGVQLNGGRAGAAEGPEAFRMALGRIGNLHAAIGPRGWPAVFDAGDVEPGETLDETHARVTEATTALLDAGLFPVGIGGGHDLTFPFVRAVAQRVAARGGGQMAGVYVDAHLDVREEPGSGMPFRKLIEECGVRELRVYGLDPVVNSAEHLAWFEAHGGRVERSGPGAAGWRGGEWVWPEGEGGVFFSFDLDAIDQAFAPGVSATNAYGLLPREAMAWARAAGAQPRVRCFDIMELSPPYDLSGRTARLAARLFLEFLIGFGERPVNDER
jgi:formiminoglutamase